jgi:hypothetical protein
MEGQPEASQKRLSKGNDTQVWICVKVYRLTECIIHSVNLCHVNKTPFYAKFNLRLIIYITVSRMLLVE